MNNILLIFSVGTLAVGSTFYSAHADLVIANDGKSAFTIVVPDKAPDSVRDAAKELQRDLEESTKAKLPIQKDNETINGAVISLGSTVQAKEAGLSAEKIPDSGFRIVTKNGNLYIIGLDTVAKVNLSRKYWGEMTLQPGIPGPQFTKDGGWSNGTANGVYTFLEDYLGMRWLMPGELGRDVQLQKKLTIPDLDRIEEPEFIYRKLGYLEQSPQALKAVSEWQNLHKLGFSYRLNYNHNWWETINRVGGGRGGYPNTDAVKKFYAEHPDWFAMNEEGKRPFPKSQYTKLETTNPEFVKWFAQQAIDYLKENPEAQTYSLSPADGRGYSKSPESLKYYDPSPTTIFDPESEPGAPSVTRLILKFYRDVSKIVEEKYPQGKVAGYLYQDFLYPPQNGDATLPENFIPVVAPGITSGYKLYRKDVQERLDYILKGWANVVPTEWFFYSLPNWHRTKDGMVTPPGNKQLNFIFSRLLKYRMKGFILYGNTSWSSAAMSNYISAKMLWNPKLDARELQREWLMRAYGVDAGTVMDEYFQKLDDWFSEYYNKYESESYHVREGIFRNFFAPHYNEIEKYFIKAAAQPMTPEQRARFDLYQESLIVLRWRMVNAGYIKAEVPSPLKRSSKEISAMMFDGSESRKTADGAFDTFPILWYGNQPSRKFMNVENVDPEAMLPQGQMKSVPNAGYILLYANQPGVIKIKSTDVRSGSAFVGYTIYEPKGKTAFRVMQRGLFHDGEDIDFEAQANQLYLLRITPQDFVAPKLDYTLLISNAKTVKGAFDGEIMYLVKNNAPVSIYIPKGLDIYADETEDGVRLRTMTPQDAARAEALKRYPDMQLRRVLDNKWKFQIDSQKIGVGQKYFASDFDDSNWKTLNATDTWQAQGFPNYHGVAWYRKSFGLSRLNKGKVLLLFGAVDGDTVVYANGEKVGEHLLGPNGEGWNEPFTVDVTDNVGKGATNITVQVTKHSNASGIYNGVALLEEKAP